MDMHGNIDMAHLFRPERGTEGNAASSQSKLNRGRGRADLRKQLHPPLTLRGPGLSPVALACTHTTHDHTHTPRLCVARR